jgi:hypothetical protein
MITTSNWKIVNLSSLSCVILADLSSHGSAAWGLPRGKIGSLLRLFARRCGPFEFAPIGLMSFSLAGCPSLGPRKNDLTNYWALGPFVRPFTSLVDPGDIYPPHVGIWSDGFGAKLIFGLRSWIWRLRKCTGSTWAWSNLARPIQIVRLQRTCTPSPCVFIKETPRNQELEPVVHPQVWLCLGKSSVVGPARFRIWRGVQCVVKIR